MIKLIASFVLTLLLLFLPHRVFAAEILQVASSSTLIIGDQNRNYTVKIACLEIDASKEKETIKYLEEILPRRTKINLKPKSSIDGILISKVIKVNSGIDVAETLVSEGFAQNDC